jgi:hypothetical protein
MARTISSMAALSPSLSPRRNEGWEGVRSSPTRAAECDPRS